MSIFEKASRIKLRFPTSRGELTVEQLWDLPLTSKTNTTPSLDGIAIALNAAIRSETQISFVDNVAKSQEQQLTQLRFDIVKHVLDTRVAENKAKLEKKQIEEQRAVLREAIAAKQKEALVSGSVEDLQAQLAILDAKAAS